MKGVHPVRVGLKAIILFALANILFAVTDPPVGYLSIYNWLVPGRARVPYEREIDYYPISHTIPVYEDLDAMFQSHLISRPKETDEYRVVLVGDSAAWAFELHPEETLASQLTALNLRTCTGKRVIVYNVAFPLPYVAKDVLIMDKVREYAPDMFIWMVTLDAFRNRTIYTDYFLEPYAERTLDLKQEYQLDTLDTEKIRLPGFWDKTIIGQRSRLKKIILLQLHGLAWSATGLDYDYRPYEPVSNDQLDSLLFDTYAPGQLDLRDMLFDVLEAGYGIAGQRPLLVVNEPIFIASGKNSDLRYNDNYPRWAYDEYLSFLSGWMKDHHHEYLDLWNAVPPSEFSNSPFHRTPQGEKTVAGILTPLLLQTACSR
jgi:hypothetical protein